MKTKLRDAKKAYDQLQYPGDLAQDIAPRALPQKTFRGRLKISRKKWIMGLAAMILLAMWLSPAPSPKGTSPRRPTLAKTPAFKRMMPRMPRRSLPSLAKASRRIPSIGKMPRAHLTFPKTPKRHTFTSLKERSS